jgi:DNA-binding transcriptional MerR regulator
MPMLLSTSAVAKLTGTTVRMVDHWARTGLFKPSGKEAAGKGSRRRYTFQDVVMVKAVRSLREGNCPLQKVRVAIRYLKSHYPDVPLSQAFARLTLLTDGKSVYLLNDERQLLEIVSRQLLVAWAVPLGRIIVDTGQQLDAMPQSWVERLVVGGRAFHVDVSRPRPSDPFMARCREAPGTEGQGHSSTDAVSRVKEALVGQGTRAVEGQRCGRSRLDRASS